MAFLVVKGEECYLAVEALHQEQHDERVFWAVAVEEDEEVATIPYSASHSQYCCRFLLGAHSYR